MLLEVINISLLIIPQVTDADRPFRTDLPVEGKQLTEVRCTDEGRGHDVMIVVTTREYLSPTKGRFSS